MWGVAVLFPEAGQFQGKGMGLGLALWRVTQSAQMFSFLWICSLYLARERTKGVGRWSLSSTGKKVRAEAVGGGAS